MKEYIAFFFIVSFLLALTVAEARFDNEKATSKSSSSASNTGSRFSTSPECPVAALGFTGELGKFFMLTLFDNPEGLKQGNGWWWGVSYTINDAAVLVDEDGNVINPSQGVTTHGGTYTLKIIGSGEYYDCGGSYDSPPITFGDNPVYNFNTPPKLTYMTGKPAPSIKVYDSVYCTNSMVTVKDNGVQIAMTPQEGMSQVSFELEEGSHQLDIQKNVECKYSFYVEGHNPNHGWVMFGPRQGGESDYGSIYAEYDSVTIPKAGSGSTALTYSLNVVDVTHPKGTCETGCSQGYICCENKCRDSLKGVCRDINGDGLLEWITLQ